MIDRLPQLAAAGAGPQPFLCAAQSSFWQTAEQSGEREESQSLLSISLAETLDSHIRLLHLPHLKLALISPSSFGTAPSFSLPFPATPPLRQKAQALSVDCFLSASAMRLEKAAVWMALSRAVEPSPSGAVRGAGDQRQA